MTNCSKSAGIGSNGGAMWAASKKAVKVFLLCSVKHHDQQRLELEGLCLNFGDRLNVNQFLETAV